MLNKNTTEEEILQRAETFHGLHNERTKLNLLIHSHIMHVNDSDLSWQDKMSYFDLLSTAFSVFKEKIANIQDEIAK